MRNSRGFLNGEVHGSIGDGVGIIVKPVGIAVRAGVRLFIDNSAAYGAEFVGGGVIGDGDGHFFAVRLHDPRV